MMTLVDDLRAARALIDTPEKWLQGDAHGVGCMCAWAACIKVARPSRGPYTDAVAEREDRILLALAKQAPVNYGNRASKVIAFNDRATTTHADIMALFDRAISAALASTKIEDTPSHD